MHKFYLVARHEFLRYATRKGFLFAVFGIPLLFGAIFGVTFLIISNQARAPVGVVDEVGWLLDPADYEPEGIGARFVSFADESAAREALQAGDLQGYFVVPEDYLQTGDVELVHSGNLFDGVYDDIVSYLRASLFAEADADPNLVAALARDGLEIEFVSLQDNDSQNEFTAFLFPFVISLMIIMSIFTTAGYMLQAVVDEKENRTMEILITSLSPGQLIGGKLAGLIVLGLVQTFIWTAAVVIAFLVARANFPELEVITFPMGPILVAVAWFIPFYVIFAALMAAIGLSVTEVSEGQQASSLITLLAVFPLSFSFLIFMGPDSPLSVAMSLIPFTSPITILIRSTLTEIPLWQYVVSWVLLAATAVFSVYLVSRVLRIGMLRYGQRLSLAQIGRALRNSEA